MECEFLDVPIRTLLLYSPISAMLYNDSSLSFCAIRRVVSMLLNAFAPFCIFLTDDVVGSAQAV